MKEAARCLPPAYAGGDLVDNTEPAEETRSALTYLLWKILPKKGMKKNNGCTAAQPSFNSRTTRHCNIHSAHFVTLPGYLRVEVT